MKNIGVLALQGAFKEHVKMIESLGQKAIEIRKVEQLNNIDGIILPGGESTTIGKLLNDFQMKETLSNKIKNGLPVWGTCAGMIILAKKIANSNTTHIPIMDIEVVRNAYGRQLGSFSVNKKVEGIEGGDIPMVFIRAPYIKEVGDNVSVLATVDNKIVAARQKNMFVTSFHPELTEDLRVHEYFINMINQDN
jgi:pyridoxal 5'-phosphate synthase pdxT subunit